jgi:hypothetical protein
MPLWHLLLMAAALQVPAGGAPAAEIETLKGERLAGELVSLEAAQALLKSGESSTAVPLAEVLEIRLKGAAAPEPSTGVRVVLQGGTHLTLNGFSIAGDQARCEAAFGSFTIPVARLVEVRFGISTTKLDEAWAALLARESKDDLLVIKKEDVLDFLAGVTGNVGAGAQDKIGFLLEGDEVPVAREKVYGIIFHRRAPNPAKTVCQVRLTSGDVLATSRFALERGQFSLRLTAGADLALTAAQVAALDFSAGKIRYLSQLEPRDVKYVPFFDIVYEYRRDKSLDGTPLALAGKTYPRGLALHSRTTLRYRIAGEYTKFQAIAGIDDEVRRNGDYSVRLVITGDNKPLFDAEVKTRDAPRPLDLDVTGVRDLEILVDFGSDMLDICDHLDLADAKLVK